MNIRLCDKLDSIPKDCQKAAFKQLVLSNQNFRQLSRLRILWMEDILKELEPNPVKIEDSNAQDKEAQKKKEMPKEKLAVNSAGNSETEMAMAFSVRDC